MKFDDQLIALCKACNWIAPHFPSTLCGWTEFKTGDRMLSNPLIDSNAMREAKLILSINQRNTYWNHLHKIITGHTANEYLIKFGKLELVDLLFPTPQQEAETFLKTLDLWKD